MFTVLWDNDGVLVDTEELYFRASRQILAKVGIELTEDVFKEISLKRGQSTMMLAAERGFGPEQLAQLRAERNRIYAESLAVEPLAVDGAEDVLRTLHGKVRMGVVTSTWREHFDIAHRRTGLPRFLDFVITNEEYQHSKPHPEPYLTALERYRIHPADCIVVEDSERGLASALAAGLECLVVLGRWTAADDFPQATRVLPDIRCVPAEVLSRARQRGF
ncbi:MAG: HAD family phosphatase [Planctomycetes bacterium]|nr:HAD family phosphatase [Planctomycetota bacterium]